MTSNVSWLDPRRKELLAKSRRLTTERWGEQFKTDIAPRLATEGWSASAIGRLNRDTADKWGRQFSETEIGMGEQQLAEEYKTGERLGSEKHALRYQGISEMGAMERLRKQIESQERIAAEERAMASSLAASNRRFSRRMGYLSAGTAVLGAGLGGYLNVAAAKAAAQNTPG